VTTAQRQAQLMKDIRVVLKRYSTTDYDPQVVVEVLSRALRRSGRKQNHLRLVDVPPIPAAKPHEILREQRKRLGLSLQTLARRTGIAQPNLSAIENGKRALGLSVAKRIGEVLKVNYRVFL
jgi:DNA-binding XRE family transcriptional regulator